MAVRLEDHWATEYPSRWARVPDVVASFLDSASAGVGEWWDERDGQLPLIGIDADPTFDEAMYIAEQYGGGEFDNECAGIVAALCVLRDHIKAVS